MNDKETCRWTSFQGQYEWCDIYYYQAECKTEDDPFFLRIQFKYCPYCGKEIEEIEEIKP